MAYRLIGDNNIVNPKEQILKNRDTTIEKLNPTEEVVEDYKNYDNILEGMKVLMKAIMYHKKIGVIIDEDNDGVASFAILYRYIKEVFNYELIILPHHKAKAHGISKDVNIPDDLDLLISPDGGTNNKEEIIDLENSGVKVLILDHHLLSSTIDKVDYGIIINNQLSENVNNKALCGAGIVYKFLYGLSKEYNLPSPEKYLDLVAIANIADAMDLSSLETRYYVKEGLKNINNPFIKAIMELKSFEMNGKCNPHAFSFNVIPLINATVRSGTFEEKVEMQQAFISDDYEFCKEVANKLKKIKQKQDSYVKKNVEKINKKLVVNKGDKVLFINGEGIDGAVVGLIATKISDKYKLPCVMYNIYDNDICSGSGRGLNGITLKEDLTSSGLMIFAEGHSNAMGISFKLENLEALKQYMNYLYKDVDFGDSKTYDVDFEIPTFFLDQCFVDQLATLEDEESKGFDAPLIAITVVEVILTDNNIKGRTNVIFEVNGIKFIKKFASKVWKEEYLYKPLECTIIGKCVKGYNGIGEIEIVSIE